MKPTVGAEELKQWEDDGYIVLKSAFSHEEIDRFNDEIDRLWEDKDPESNPFMIDFWEGNLFGQRMRLIDAPPGSRKYIHKLSNMYIDSESCRDMALAPVIGDALRKLMDSDPMVINSLVFEKGSQQPDHFDTYHMPPPNDGILAVSSICLEDINPDAGPVQVYPGSHKIPPYIFSNGEIKMTDRTESQAAADYTAKELTSRNIQKKPFIGKKGDVLFWHGQLYHGGSEIKNHQLTRKTLVCHYWRPQDLIRKHLLAQHREGLYYMARSHAQPAKLQ